MVDIFDCGVICGVIMKRCKIIALRNLVEYLVT